VKRLTSEEVRVDESVDRYLGPLADFEGMKPKLLDLILNGPVLNGVSKDVLRQIIRQLYSALAAYEGTERTPEEVTALGNLFDYALEESKTLTEQLALLNRIRELAEADRDGRLVVLPCKVGDELWTFCSYPVEQVYSFTVTHISTLNGRTMLNTSRCGVIDARDVGKTVFLTREKAEKALEAMK